MAEFFVHNSLNPNKTVKFNITLRYFVIKGEEGEHMWTLEVGTTHLDAGGEAMSSARAHNVTVSNLDEIIEDMVSSLCSQIDWSPLVDDIDAPFVSSTRPTNGDTSASIGTDIMITITDNLPSAGIDLSAIKVTLNNDTQDFDITSEIVTVGDPYEFELRWEPPIRVYARYNS